MEKGSLISSFGKLALAVFLAIPILQYVFTDNTTFIDVDSFLRLFSQAPTISLDFINEVFAVDPDILGSDWSFFEPLRVFFLGLLMMLADYFKMSSYLTVGVLNALSFIFYFIGYIFGI